MTDYELANFSRKCSVTGRDIAPGEEYVSALMVEGGVPQRRDFSLENWQAVSENAIAWWRSRLPAAGGGGPRWAPSEAMLRLLEDRTGDPAAEDLCYVLALLMIRRKILRLEATERDPGGQEMLVLFAPKTEVEYRVPVVVPNEPRAEEIQQFLRRLLLVEDDTSDAMAPHDS